MASFRQSLRALLQLLSAYEASADRTTGPWLLYKEGHERGIQLLTGNLSPAQREQYETRGYFEVIGGDTGKRYRIRHGHQMNVELLDKNGRRMRLLCFMPEGHVAVGDVMLAQKIALELFETEALRVANEIPAGDYILEESMRITRGYRRL